MSEQRTDVVVIGGGQAGLAMAYFLRRHKISYVVLDDQPAPGGAWRRTWPSLRLFSPTGYSSLPGWPMPPHHPGNPDAPHVIDYLTRYEERYDIPVRRPVTVRRVTRCDLDSKPASGSPESAPGPPQPAHSSFFELAEGSSQPADGFRIETTGGETWLAAAVVSATGTWSRQFVPFQPGMDLFTGTQTHSAFYAGPEAYAGRRVLIVGGANSGAQIAAELSWVSDLTWCTLEPPRYLPDDVDGRELFRLATDRVRGKGRPIGSLGDIVALPPVRKARNAGGLRAIRMFERFTATGIAFADGTERPIDDVIWCTGFRPALTHLTGLDLPRSGRRIRTDGTPRVPGFPGLYLLGYGDWCGPASATLIGVGQWARLIVTDLMSDWSGLPRGDTRSTTLRT